MASRNPFSMTCCVRALLEDLSLTQRSLRTVSTRPRVLMPSAYQVRSLTTTHQPRQFVPGSTPPTVDEFAQEEDDEAAADAITGSARGLLKKEQEEGGDELVLPPGCRVVPASPSYFTGNSAFYDTYFGLKELLYKYETLPTVSPTEAPRVIWKSLADFRSVAGGTVQSSKYKKVQSILSRLNRIHPDLMPTDVRDALALYKRPDIEELLHRRPKIIDRFGRARGDGGRKTSSAEAYLVEGDGGCFVNGKSLVEMFPRLHDRESVIWPLKVTNRVDRYNIWGSSKGGGISGQAGALTLAVAKALLTHEPHLKPVLRRAGVITRDPRTVERKKHGKLKARKMPAWIAR